MAHTLEASAEFARLVRDLRGRPQPSFVTTATSPTVTAPFIDPAPGAEEKVEQLIQGGGPTGPSFPVFPQPTSPPPIAPLPVPTTPDQTSQISRLIELGLTLEQITALGPNADLAAVIAELERMQAQPAPTVPSAPPPSPPLAPPPPPPPAPVSVVDQILGDLPTGPDPNIAARQLFGESFAGSPLITPRGFEQLRQGKLPLFNQITPGFLLYGSPIMRETLAGLFESSSIRPQDLLFEIGKNRPPGFAGEGVGLTRFGGFSLL